MVGQFQRFAADLERIGVAERYGRQRPVRIVVARKQLPGLLVGDDDRASAETSGTADMIGVRMTVNNMGDRLVGDFGDRLGNQRGVAGRRVYHDNAALMDQEHGLVGVLSHHVEVSAEALESIALRGPFAASTAGPLAESGMSMCLPMRTPGGAISGIFS